MCALYPGSETLPAVADLDVDGYLDRFRKDAVFPLRAGIVLAALIFALTPIITLGIPLPSFLLPRRLLDKHAHKVVGHSFYLVRQPVFILKMVAGMCWGEHPKVRECFHLAPYPADPRTRRMP